MRAKKTYTGNKDGVAAGERPGLTELIKHLVYLSEGALWNNGTFVNRPNAQFQESVCACHRQSSRP
jgi:hypothetical protein